MVLRVLTVLGGGRSGGAEAFYVSLTLALARSGMAVHTALKHNDQRETTFRAAGIDYDTARFGKHLDFSTGAKLRRVARGFRPDIVLSFAGRASAMMPVGNYTLIGRLGGYYSLKNFARCDDIVCNTPDLVRYVVEGGWPEERVFHIPNFPNIESGEPVDRASLQTPKDVPLVLSLGRLHPNKAFDVLLRAAARVPNLWVWIAGEGDERRKLEALARELGVDNRVKFLGWRNDKAGLFKAADLCVYPSRREPFGNVVVEAWGYGVPLVTTASTGPKWLVRDREDGLLTPVDDDAALAEGIRTIIDSPALAREMVENGRRRIVADFSEQAIVGKYGALFQRLRPKQEN